MNKDITNKVQGEISHNNTILIIEDEPEVLLLLESILVRRNFQVEKTTDARNALELAKKIQPGLILLGIKAPGLSGYNSCKQIKQNESTRQIPVILMSVLSDENSIYQGFEAGAADFISKPIQQLDFFARVNAQLVNRNLQIEYENKNKQLLLQIKKNEQAESLLKKSEERYRLISNVMTDYMFSTNVLPDGSLELDWVAGAFDTISGYSPEEYKALGGWRATIHPDDLPIDDKDLENLRNNQKVVSELRTINRNGEIVWVQVFAFPVWDEKKNSLKGIYGAVQDITSRKNTEIRLISSESQYRELLEKVGLIAVILDINGKVIFANDFLLELTGYTHHELIGCDWFEKMIPENHKQIKNLFLNNLQIGDIALQFENPIQTKSGKHLDIVWSNVVQYNSEGKIATVASIGEDITDRKSAELALKESELLFRSFFENNTSYMLQIDSESGNIIDANPTASDFYGYSIEQLRKMNINQINIAPEENIHKIILQIKHSIQNHHIVSHRLANGEIRVVEIYATPIIINTKSIHLVIIHDITDKKNAEEKINSLNYELEQRVEIRTRELEDLNANLARMNKLFVGRELKMIELKNKILELENKLKM